MKRITFLIAIIISFTSCKSLYNIPMEPNIPMEKNILIQNDINSIQGAYVSFTKSVTLYQLNTDNKKEESVEGGIVYSQSYLFGENFYLNQRIPIYYYNGSDKGKPVIINGKPKTTPLLGEINSFKANEKRELESINVILDGTLGEVTLPFILRFADSDFLFLKLLKRSEEGLNIKDVYTDKNDYWYIVKNGQKHFFIKDLSEIIWIISEKDSLLSLDKIPARTGLKDEREKNIAKSKVIGQ